MERSIVWSYLGAALLLGAGVATPKSPYGIAVLVLLAAISARGLTSFFELGATENEDWRTAFIAWRQLVVPPKPAQAALFCSAATAIPMLYYARQEKSLPPLLAWGTTDGGPGIALLADRSTADLNKPDWLEEIPQGLFLWKRGAIDEGRRLLPPLPDDGCWREPAWQRLAVVFSHCPEDSADALNTALSDAGWALRVSSEFIGGESALYACTRAGCFLPGQQPPVSQRSKPPLLVPGRQ